MNNQVNCDASLRSWPLPCKAGKTWAGGLLPQFVALRLVLQATFPTALHRTCPASFYLLSPEAVQLTLVNTLRIVLKLKEIKKAGKGLPIHRAGCMARAAEAIGLA
ncbi:hypothetical protein ACFS5N_13885 [Mucilaginibacter ximonensis]|uniref:Uncharacterized protein n=1 Tax=Mucilaginibacter ximonensis TaxID=538021 RepID=A0ABW5YFI3_9SPHI